MRIGDRINPPRKRKRGTVKSDSELEPLRAVTIDGEPFVLVEVPPPEPPPSNDRFLSKEDLFKLEAARLRRERAELATQLLPYRIDEVTRIANARVKEMSAQLERDVIERRMAQEKFAAIQKDIETRYQIDLSVVSYDDETGLIVEPEGDKANGIT